MPLPTNPRRPRANQMDTDFYFDGIDGSALPSPKSDPCYENTFLKMSGVSNPAAEGSGRANYGAGPRTGNASDSPRQFRGAGNPTAERTKKTIATAAQGRNTQYGSAEREYPRDPDRINVGNTGGRATRTHLK